MQPGAYITDGIDLYEVTGTQRGPGVMGVSTVRITLENCRNLRCLEFLPDKIRTTFQLVKTAPVGSCPEPSPSPGTGPRGLRARDSSR